MKVWPPVQELAFARLRFAVRVPPNEAGEPPTVMVPLEESAMVEFARFAFATQPAQFSVVKLKLGTESEVPCAAAKRRF
jgi:hypothetical protein